MARVVDAETDRRAIVGVVNDYFESWIASVTVRSPIYQEYVHLVRTRDGWKIVNTLWQRTMPEGGEASG
jgi:hypothetical protein